MSASSLHWDDLELLRLLAREGTAAAASRRLGIDQTTVSRRLARMEHTVGTALFDRLDRRLVPTPALVVALGDLDRMADAATVAGNAMRAAQSRLTGQVSISAVDPIASWVLAPRVGTLARTHPDLSIELRQENRNVSLARREADIALRLGRPDGDDALTRRIGTIAYCLAGPANISDPYELPIAGYTDDLDHLPDARWLAAQFPDRHPSLRVGTLRAYVEAASSGFRAVLPRFVVATDKRLREISTAIDGPSRELWLLLHPDRRRDPAIAAVVGWIEASVKEAIGNDR